ncbi:hypothetical protein C0581_00205 [Candidatus Parcubacteria bacterium]|nr:MAG: hypothetical protein C0581_00205 [Candidatus Parcubacteria bacterium]
MQRFFKTYYPTLILSSVFLLGVLILLKFIPEGFIPLDQRGIFWRFAYEPMLNLQGRTLEYPIGAWMFFKSITFPAYVLKNIFSQPWGAYHFSFSFVIACFYLATWTLTLAWLKFKTVKKQLWLGATFLLFFICANPFLILSTFDLVPTFFAFLSLFLFQNKKYKSSAVILALATTIKWFPGVLLPIFLIHLLQSKKELLKYLLTYKTTIILIVLIGSIFVPLGIQGGGLLYHSDRGIHNESLYGNMFYMAAQSQESYMTTLGHGSLNIEGPGINNALPFIFPIMILGLLFVYYKSYKNKNDVVRYSLLAILTFILLNKVLSPQFLFWLIPFVIYFVFENINKKNIILLGVFAIILLLGPTVPFYMQESLINFEWEALSLLTLRNILLGSLLLI